jgi:restriction system protein
MAVPGFQEFTLPLLLITSDGREYGQADVLDRLARDLHLADEDLHEMLPSGRKTRIEDRVAWAQTYLRKACLLESPRRGVFRITDRGREVLRTKPTRIDIAYLSRFPEFQAFRHSQSQPQRGDDSESRDPDQTPQEILEASYQSLRREVAVELLDRMKSMPLRTISGRSSRCDGIRWLASRCRAGDRSKRRWRD